MEGGIFKRRIYGKLLDWKLKYSDEYALMIEGARRVGKSTIVRELAENEFESCMIIDFNDPLEGTIVAFEKYGHDLPKLFMHLQQIYGVQLHGKDSLVVFDDVQKYPRARELIKYLVRDTDYCYIETGSLISIWQNVKDIQIPSEEMKLEMHPMDFEEFLNACGDVMTFPLLRKAFAEREPVGEILHRSAMEKFKTYLLVGGMPEAVSEYLETKDMDRVEAVKKTIIGFYRDNMREISRGNGIHAALMFEKAPAMLSKRKKVFSPGMIKQGTSTSDYETSLYWLTSAKICNRCIETSNPNPAMNICLDEKKFKCYLLDTGLLLTLAFDKGDLSRRDAYMAFLKGKLSMNEGMVFENAVAQMLVAAGAELHFHEFYRKNDDRHLYEMDFVLADGKKVIPIEVKSANSTPHASLDEFIAKYRKIVKDPIIIHPRDLRIADGITYIPIYMTPFLAEKDDEELPPLPPWS